MSQEHVYRHSFLLRGGLLFAFVLISAMVLETVVSTPNLDLRSGFFVIPVVGCGVPLAGWYLLSGSLRVDSQRIERRRWFWSQSIQVSEIQSIETRGETLKVESPARTLKVSKFLPHYHDMQEKLLAVAPLAAHPKPLALPWSTRLRIRDRFQEAGYWLGWAGVGALAAHDPSPKMLGILALCTLALGYSIAFEERSVSITDETLELAFLFRTKTLPMADLRAVDLAIGEEDPLGTLTLTFEGQGRVTIEGARFPIEMEPLRDLLQGWLGRGS